MAYSTDLPPQAIISVPGISGGTFTMWLYRSADVHTDVDASDYFSNGDALGMKVGDVVLVQETDNSYATTRHVVSSVTSGGAATVGASLD